MQFMRKLLTLLFAASLFLMGVASASAYVTSDWRNPYYGYGYPIYTSGYYAYPYTYGFSGWSYNRVYYNYHYSYPTYAYGGYNYYPGYYAAPGWTRYYNVAVWPVYPAY